MADKEAMVCPNCGSKKFIFVSDTICKCDYCNAEWKLTDILGLKKIEFDAKLKESRQKHLIDAVTKLLSNEMFVGFTIIGLLVLGYMIFAIVVIK